MNKRSKKLRKDEVKKKALSIEKRALDVSFILFARTRIYSFDDSTAPVLEQTFGTYEITKIDSFCKELSKKTKNVFIVCGKFVYFPKEKKEEVKEIHFRDFDKQQEGEEHRRTLSILEDPNFPNSFYCYTNSFDKNKKAMEKRVFDILSERKRYLDYQILPLLQLYFQPLTEN